MGILDYIVKLNPATSKATVLCVGLDKSGKTSLLRQLSGEDMTRVTPTHGFIIKTLETRGVKLNVWDVGGQAKVRFYWRQYYDDADLLMFVFDVSDEERYEEAKGEVQHLLEEESLAGVPILLVANKCDLKTVNLEWLVEFFDLEKLTGERFWQIRECSAKSGEGIPEVVRWVVQRIKDKK